MFACVRVIPRGCHAEEEPRTVRQGEETAIIRLAREFSPRVEPLDPETVLLEIGGLTSLFGDAPALAGALRAAASGRGLAVRVVVATTRTTVCLLGYARPREGLIVVPIGHEAGALAPLPLEVLSRVPIASLRASAGTGNRTPDTDGMLRTCRRWGLRTFGDLAALPPDGLHARLGEPGVWLWRMAHGEERRPLVSMPEIDPCEARLALDWPIEGLEPLAFVLGRLFETLCARLERVGAGATAVETHLRLVTREIVVRRIEWPAAIRDPRVLRTLVLIDLESHPIDALAADASRSERGGLQAAGIDEVAVRLETAPGRVVQYSLLDPVRPAPERYSTLLARLRALMGDTRVGIASLLDSHRPGAFAIGEVMARRSDDVPRPDRPPPGAGTPVLRRFRIPVPARVVLEHGRPVRVTTERPGLRGGRVEGCAGPWRTSGAWWAVPFGARGMKSEAGRQWVHDEWDVALGDGGVYRLCRDRLRDGWVVEGVVD